MSKSRQFFYSSPQETTKLLVKQVGGRAVKPIQDVTTRWWSTYTMCDQLLRLKMYLCLLENEGSLTCNITESQWCIVHDFAHSFETLYDCAETIGRTDICDYKLFTLNHLQDQERPSRSH